MLNKKLLFVISFIFVTCVADTKLFSQIFNVTQSALSDGQIVKLSVSKSGIYKITKKNLEDYGFNTASLNPQNIKIYTNYGGMLPEPIVQSYPDDLIEIPIVVTGESDGKMNDEDYVLFYADGADVWKTNNNNEYYYEKNIYDNANYVFLKLSDTKGKRIQVKNISNDAISFSTDSYQQLQVFTEDKTNLLGSNLATNGSGKLWVGEYLVNNQEKDVTSLFSYTNILPEKGIRIKAVAYGRSGSESKFVLTINGNKFENKISSVTLTNDEATYARQSTIQQTISNLTLNPTIKYNYSASSGGDAWLDYLTLESYHSIPTPAQQLFIRHPDFRNHDHSSITIQGSLSGTRLWRIDDLQNIAEYGHSGQNINIETNFKNAQFVFFKDNVAFTPLFISKIANKNLHGLKDEDLIIVYHSNFKEAVQKLADHRKSHNNYTVDIVEVSDVYNEFSSGKKDVSAIRNLSKMIYDRTQNFKFLLLFGDGTYDYRNLVKNIPDHNFVPVYETNESLNPVNAFPTDDYYALLSNNEGNNLDGALDISVGRIPVTNNDEAMAVVQKIIDYDTSPKRFGDWRLNTSFSSDDGDNNLHFRDADKIANESFVNDPVYNQQKIYFDAFVQENTPGGERYDDASEAINQNMNKGLLTWSYLGHGGPKGLAQERVVKIPDITSWTNYNSLALMITATCSFTGYDDPSITSGGEEAILNPKGGAIALLTTTRPVYASENARLTSSVYKNLYKKINGSNPTFGHIINSAKNATFQDTTGDNTRKFSLIGDPSQVLSTPQHQIVITSINDINADSFKTSVSALDKIVIKGRIEDHTQSVLTNFNGELSMTIYDKLSTLKTLGNDSDSKVANFNVFKNIIFKGKTKFENGYFQIECIIPKDINYQVGFGRISMYAHDDETDGAGHFSKLSIGGNSSGGIVDNLPPRIGVFMNDDAFISGGITNSAPSIYLKLEDDFGINITGNSIGHDITAKISSEDGETEYILNDFYKSDVGSTSNGTVTYPLSKLKSGKYTVEAKAWDISNNSVEGKTEFYVVDNGTTGLSRVYNYPNPFTTNTSFNFEHDLAGQNLETLIYIYTISGKLAMTLKNEQFSTGFRGNSINWNGKDDFGSNLARGVYLYKIVVKSQETGMRRESPFMKMVKI